MTVEQWISTGASPGAPGPGGARASFDAVIVDPPRIGLSPEACAWLCAAQPLNLRYVSCNPVTLSRDLAKLLAGGFALEDLRLFDFYPQTSHIEAVAKLRGKR
jgi:23S rRNA (uracil1939-C5)-methyltransferase